MHNDSWINDVIRQGLVKMLSLRLNGCPPDDMIELTARTWLETVTDGREWERGRDESRMRAAFVTLAKIRETWPAPKHFLEAIPPVEPLKAIEKEHRPATPEQIAAHAAELRAALGAVVKPMPAAKVERETTPEQREAIETDLRAHYGKAAAAGPDL